MADCVFARYRALRDYCDKIPGHRRESKTHISTLIRWATKGVTTPGGKRVKLRAVRAGAKWLTTDEWFEEFITALTAANQTDGDDGSAPIRSPAARNRASAAAERELNERGIR